MNVLLSIKPKYVEEIKKGTKKYEFRKTRFREKYINEAYIYSTSPVKRIVGYFTIRNIIEDHPKALWADLKDVSGIEEDEFFSYFDNKDRGFAIEINKFEMFDDPIDPKTIIPNFVAPQSFRYLETNELDSNNFVNLDHFVSK